MTASAERDAADALDERVGDHRQEAPSGSWRDELARLAGELFGTFALTMVAAGGEVIAAVSHGEVSPAARAVAPGLMVMALIYAVGDVSGAHFNPAVTFAFALRRVFPWCQLPAYWLAQLAGALLAAGLLRLLFGRAAHVGATRPEHGALTAVVMEVVLTLFLVTVILGTASRGMVVGPNAALAVGGTIALDGLFAAPISGASMNPARSLGPALLGGTMGTAWIYLLGPLAGAALATLLIWLMKGRERSPEEK
ncbi:MAG: aquaporin, partial [Thermomicrobiaceae bacterium]|nr:aquaporin [Thermomicrobiaceae bacterium]